MDRIILNLSIILFLGLAQTAGAAGQTQQRDSYFLTLADVDLSNFPEPPEAGSPEDLADREVVKKIHTQRTAESCAVARKDASLGLADTFGSVLPALNPQEMQSLEALYWKLHLDTDIFVFALKNRWNRLRPFQADASIQLCIPSHNSTSYPSGHSSIAHTGSLMLVQLFPNHRQAILKRADEAAMSRVIGGVHHVKDIEAGKTLSRLVYQAFMKNPEFVKSLNQVRAQIAAAQK